MTDGDILGEGTSSICHRGIDMVTKEQVAIKIYKQSRKEAAPNSKTLTKFRRQVRVLQELQQPLVPPADPQLWSDELAQAAPGDLFVRLLGYSQGQDGTPGPDHRDGNLYIVTELAQYDLKQYLRERRDQHQPLSREKVQSIAKAIILSVAGLHAKGFTHLDLKPANLMMFGGRWKLIDVDGCVKVGDAVDAGDDTLSFSPCYCAPEWARFVVQDSQEPMFASPSLDTWSIGMTLCELITLDPPMKVKYQEMAESNLSSRAACFRFLSWLGKVRKLQLPGAIGRFDEDFHDLLSKWLLVCDKSMRKSLAECLSCPFLATTPTADIPKESLKYALKRVGSGHSLFGAAPVVVE
jgi:serine/threonine protein kinase